MMHAARARMIGVSLALAAAQPLRDMRLGGDVIVVATTAQEQRRRDPVAKAAAAIDRVRLSYRRRRPRRPSEADVAAMVAAQAKRLRRQERNMLAVAAGGMIGA